MGRRNATSWLIGLLVVAIGAVGLLRDVHAASHAARDAQAACLIEDEHPEHTLPAPAAPADPDATDCDTCDLLAVLSKSIDTSTPTGPVATGEFVSPLLLPTPERPVVAEQRRADRSRAPPAAFRCAV